MSSFAEISDSLAMWENGRAERVVFQRYVEGSFFSATSEEADVVTSVDFLCARQNHTISLARESRYRLRQAGRYCIDFSLFFLMESLC